MITDPVFYRLFATAPETFFLVLGLPPEEARRQADRYEFAALELKETAHRCDGVFRPKKPDWPVYFVEVQFYDRPNIFADVLAKAYTYLKQNNPGQPYYAVVLFESRALAPRALTPYQPLLDAGFLRCFYLDEMPELADAPLGLSIIYLLRRLESETPAQARTLIARVQREIGDTALRAHLVELIETVVLYKQPRLTREEIMAMFAVHDIRQTRIYQEAKEEGRQEGRAEAVEQERQRIMGEKLQAIPKLAAKKLSTTDIADILGLDEAFVREQLTSRGRKRRTGGKTGRKKGQGGSRN